MIANHTEEFKKKMKIYKNYSDIMQIFFSINNVTKEYFPINKVPENVVMALIDLHHKIRETEEQLDFTIDLILKETDKFSNSAEKPKIAGRCF
jgi:hypothetical protein